MQILGYSLIKGHLDVGEWMTTCCLLLPVSSKTALDSRLQDFFDVNDRRLRPLWTSDPRFSGIPVHACGMSSRACSTKGTTQ